MGRAARKRTEEQIRAAAEHLVAWQYSARTVAQLENDIARMKWTVEHGEPLKDYRDVSFRGWSSPGEDFVAVKLEDGTLSHIVNLVAYNNDIARLVEQKKRAKGNRRKFGWTCRALGMDEAEQELALTLFLDGDHNWGTDLWRTGRAGRSQQLAYLSSKLHRAARQAIEIARVTL